MSTAACLLHLFAALLDQLGHQRRPAGLVARAEARAGFAVKIFVEKNQIAPVRIVLEKCRCRRRRGAGRRAAGKYG